MKAEAFRGTLKHYMELRHIKGYARLQELSEIGSYHTFKKYLDDPGKIPIDVYFNIMKSLNVPLEEQMKLLREDK